MAGLQDLLSRMDPEDQARALSEASRAAQESNLTGSQRVAGIGGAVVGEMMRNATGAERRRLRAIDRALDTARGTGLTKSARTALTNAALGAVTPQEEGGGDSGQRVSRTPKEETPPPGVDPGLFKRYQRFQGKQKEQQMLDEMDAQYYRRVAAAGRGAPLMRAPSTAMRLRRGRSLGQPNDFRIPSLAASESTPAGSGSAPGYSSITPGSGSLEERRRGSGNTFGDNDVDPAFRTRSLRRDLG